MHCSHKSLDSGLIMLFDILQYDQPSNKILDTPTLLHCAEFVWSQPPLSGPGRPPLGQSNPIFLSVHGYHF